MHLIECKATDVSGPFCLNQAAHGKSVASARGIAAQSAQNPDQLFG
jgi:hypothetical protein